MSWEGVIYTILAQWFLGETDTHEQVGLLSRYVIVLSVHLNGVSVEGIYLKWLEYIILVSYQNLVSLNHVKSLLSIYKNLVSLNISKAYCQSTKSRKNLIRILYMWKWRSLYVWDDWHKETWYLKLETFRNDRNFKIIKMML